MKSSYLAVALIGVLGLTASLASQAAQPAVLRVMVVQTADVGAYTHELEVLRALYKKQGIAATIEAYRATFAAANTGSIVVTVQVPNLAAYAKLREAADTQPDLVAEMKKINAMRKVVSDSLYDKLTQ